MTIDIDLSYPVQKLGEAIDKEIINILSRKPVLIYTGRFQPFHLGHLKCIKEAYEETGLKTVIVGTTSLNRKSNKKYFFSKEQTEKIIKSSLKGYEQFIEFVYIEKKVPNIYNVVNRLRSLDFEPKGWIFGKDRIDILRQVSNPKYQEELRLIDFKPYLIERNDDDISGTNIRNLIIEDKEFEQFLNCSKEMSNKVREWLLTHLSVQGQKTM